MYQTEFVRKYLAQNCSGRPLQRHDWSDETDYRFGMERFGGEERIRAHYPELYQLIQRSREAAITRKRQAMPPVSNQLQAPYVEALTDSMKIRTLNYSPTTNLSTSSSSSFIKENPTLTLVGDISDMRTGKSLNGFSVYSLNSHHLLGKCTVNSSGLIKSDEREYCASSTFGYITYDAEGKPILEYATEKSDVVKVRKASTLVNQVTVESPAPVKHPKAAQTMIFYNNRQGSECDYYYNEVMVTDKDVAVHIPFKGSVQFASGFIPEYVDKNNSFMLQIENINNGVAQFNTAHWGEIKWHVNGTTLSWEFPDNWYSTLKKNNLALANDVNFYCKMNVKLNIGLFVPIVIQSDGEEHEDPSYKKIKPLEIQWGCFARGTKILMADRSCKSIEQIKPGDQVMCHGSGAVAVRDVVTGREASMVHIETGCGKSILVTKDHPMLTSEGMVLAEDLNAGSIVEMEYGKDSIEALYQQEYNDAVYNLALASKGVIVANGFLAGDFDTQNSLPGKQAQKPVETKKLEAYQEEIAHLFVALEQEGGR